MTETQSDRLRIPESQADEPTRQRLAKARRRPRVALARKLKVTKQTVQRCEKRADLYISMLRECVERKGDKLWLEVTFPTQPPVILSGLGGDQGEKRSKKKAGNTAKSKPKTRRAA